MIVASGKTLTQAVGGLSSAAMVVTAIAVVMPSAMVVATIEAAAIPRPPHCAAIIAPGIDTYDAGTEPCGNGKHKA
jgi:hypothetical protein